MTIAALKKWAALVPTVAALIAAVVGGLTMLGVLSPRTSGLIGLVVGLLGAVAGLIAWRAGVVVEAVRESSEWRPLTAVQRERFIRSLAECRGEIEIVSVEGTAPQAFAESVREALDAAGWSGKQDTFFGSRPTSLVGLQLVVRGHPAAYVHVLRRALHDIGFTAGKVQDEVDVPRLTVGHRPRRQAA